MSITTASKKTSLFNGLLIWFMVAMILANVAGNMYGTMLPLYLKSLDASVVQVGLFFTLSQIVPLALQILGGWISDNLGRLRSIAWGSIAGVLSYVGLLLAPTWQWVLVGEGIGALTRALVGPSFGSFIAEQSSEENRARVYGILQTIYGVVIVIGPPLGGWLVDRYGFKFMLLVAALIYVSATIIRIAMARQAARKREKKHANLTLKKLGSDFKIILGLFIAGGLVTWLLVTDGVRDISYAMSFNLMPLYLNGIGGLSVQQVGWLASFYGIASMVMNIPAGWLADKKTERLAIIFGYLLLFAGIFTFLKADGFVGFVVSWILMGLGDGMMGPAYMSLISKAVPEKQRGIAFGFMLTSLGLFSLPAPAIGAKLWERYSPRVPFIISAVVSLVVIIPVWLKFRLPEKVDKKADPQQG